jgi:hypothetical protein
MHAMIVRSPGACVSVGCGMDARAERNLAMSLGSWGTQDGVMEMGGNFFSSPSIVSPTITMEKVSTTKLPGRRGSKHTSRGDKI